MALRLDRYGMSGRADASSDEPSRTAAGCSHSLAATLFAAVALVYLSLSPGVIAHMGYAAEEMRTGNLLLSRWGVGSRTEMESSHPAESSLPSKPGRRSDWSRHGALPVLLDLPFLAVGRVLERRTGITQEQVLSVSPVLWTSGMIALLFVWLCRITQHALWSYTLSLIAAFCTLLWPYAYIGLEPKQSLCVVAAGYLAFATARRATYLRSLLLGLACAGAISLKASGTYLIPAIAFLIGVYTLRQRRAPDPSWPWHMLLVLALAVVVYAGNAVTRSWFWNPRGGTVAFAAKWLVDGPVAFLFNLFAQLASPTKGLIVYSPVCLLALLAMRHAWHRDRVLVTFCALVLGGTAVGFAMLRGWSDETWGARYLHITVVPLIVCLGLTVRTFRPAHKVALATTAVLGLWIAALGSFCYYGTLHGVANATEQGTLEAFQSDLVWNHVAFNARLFSIWWSGSPGPAMWTPRHQWWSTRPPDAPEWKSFDLRLVAQPQSILLRGWGSPKAGSALVVWTGYLLCLIAGLGLLVYTGVRAVRQGPGGIPLASALQPRMLS
jgi:hypothetical protein